MRIKKFILVPQSHVPSPLAQRLGDLDREMKIILDRDDLGDYEKAREYSSTLEKYLRVKSRLTQPQAIPLIEEKEESKQDVHRSLTQSNIDYSVFPKTYRHKAMNLVKFIEENTQLKWDERGQILDKGVVVPGSHIVDLVDDITRTKSTKLGHISPPTGLNIFIREIMESNTPRALIGNIARLEQKDPTLVVKPQKETLSPIVVKSPRGRGRPQSGRGRIIRWESQ